MADLPQKPGTLRPTVNPVGGTEDASSQALNEALGSSFVLVRLLGVVLVAAFVFSCVFTGDSKRAARFFVGVMRARNRGDWGGRC